jgi:mRNA interferase MazF
VDVVTHPRRDEVWLVELDPAQGSEIRKTQPAIVVSPDEANEHLRTVIVAPMTSTERPYPTRVSITFQNITFQNVRGQVALDQIRALDRQRLVRKLGVAPAKAAVDVSAVLVEMFSRR